MSHNYATRLWTQAACSCDLMDLQYASLSDFLAKDSEENEKKQRCVIDDAGIAAQKFTT